MGIWPRRAVFALLAAAAAWAAAMAVGAFLRADFLASYRESRRTMDEQRVAVELGEVRLRMYRGGREVAQARVAHVDVMRNRQNLECRGVSDGLYRMADGGVMRFSAERGLWNANAGLFEGVARSRVWNASMDLATDRFVYDERLGELTVPGILRGRFHEGTLEAHSLTYLAKTGDYRFGPAKWTGAIDLQEQPASRTRWTLKTDGIVRRRGDVETWPKAEATDGEVIVRANQIERNVKTDVLVATGDVRYYGEKENLSCAKVTVFRKEKRAVLEGDVNLFIKAEGQQKLEAVELTPLRPIVPDEIAKSRPPAPPNEEEKKLDDELRQGGNRRKYPTTILCKRIEYWYRKGERRAVLSGEPQARQDLPGGRWRAIWTHSATYDGEAERLKMASAEGKKDTRIKTSLGDDLVAKWIEVSTKEDDDEWSAEGLEGTVVADDEEIPRDERGGGGKPPISGPIGRRA